MKLVFALEILLCCLGWSLAETDLGDGITHKLLVSQDVALERPTVNHNNLNYLLVGKHPQYPNKRSLLQFDDLDTNACSVDKIRWARMYIYYSYAHKASWHSVSQTPFRSRPIQVYQVNKEWDETQARSNIRTTGNYWAQEYLKITGTNPDAGPAVIDTVTIETSRPAGFVEFDVTSVVKAWANGDSNYGVLLRTTTEYIEGRGIRFFSNHYSDSSKHAFINVLCDY